MKKMALALLATLLLSACSSLQTSNMNDAINRYDKWAMLPMVNNTDTPQAGLRAEAIVHTLMLNRGLKELSLYPVELNNDTLFEPSERKLVDKTREWAKSQGIRYVITGSVEEWQYKVGVDGEPAVGLTLKVIDLNNNTVVWSAVGAKSGWSRSALSAVAQDLARDLLDGLKID
jgi:TolB-like protein